MPEPSPKLETFDPLLGERDAEPFWRSFAHFSDFVWAGFTPWSLLPLGLVIVTVVSVAVGWWDLVDLNQPFDFLLAFLWLFMTSLVSWRVSLRRDLILVCVGILGGFMIEWWGTTTELWTYFTNERPPMWIIPAWPVAALSTERLAYMLDRAFPRGRALPWWAVYVFVLPAFILWMCGFMNPSWHVTSSHVVLGIMIGVAVSTRTPRRDVVLFIMGTALGYGLEYWGTTRECWTYHTGETPPLVTAFAHGFASVAFWRASHVIHTVFDMVASALRSGRSSREGTRAAEPELLHAAVECGAVEPE